MSDYKIERVTGAELDLGDQLLIQGALRAIEAINDGPIRQLRFDDGEWRPCAVGAIYAIQRPIPDVEDLGDQDWDDDAESEDVEYMNIPGLGIVATVPDGERESDSHGLECQCFECIQGDPIRPEMTLAELRQMERTETTVESVGRPPQPGDPVTCPECYKTVKVTKHGKIAAHGPILARCVAGGTDPRG